MKIFTLLASILLFSAATASHADTNSTIDDILSEHIAGDYNVGAIVGVQRQDKSEVWSQGRVKLGRSETPSDKTIFEIGSISKVFTGILLADLVINGIVSLDDPIAKFLPELENVPTGQITLIELSTHTSGLPRLPTNFVPANMLDPYADYTEAKLIEFLVSYPLGSRPTEFSWHNYSNVGVGLLGYVLTKATGLSYEELLRTKITGPLSMPDTVIKLNQEQHARFATPYSASLDEVLPWDLAVLVGAGGIRSTLADLFKFLAANLQPDHTPLAEALKLAQRVHRTNGKDSIGLGFGIWDYASWTMIGHNGGTGGFASYLAFDLKNNVGFIALTNTASSLQCLETLVFQNAECKPNFGASVPDHLLDSYLGTYRDSTGIEVNITRRARYLVYEIVGHEKGRLVAMSGTKFNVLGVATIEFFTDPSGVVTHFEFKQADFVGRFTKISR